VDDAIVDRPDLVANAVELVDADGATLLCEPRDAPVRCR
jgi:hypothetical protein